MKDITPMEIDDFVARYMKQAVDSLMKDWDEAFALLVEGEELSDDQKAILRMLPDVPFGDSILSIRV